MLIPLPEPIARQIAARAVQYCRQDLQGRGWKSARALMPLSQQGMVGIKTSAKFLMYQEKGIRPFLMKWVKGQIVPLKGPGGTTNFRKGSGVGKPGYVNIPGKGRVWRQQRWRHPGLKPKAFMRSAIQKAITDSHNDIKVEIMRALKGEL